MPDDRQTDAKHVSHSLPKSTFGQRVSHEKHCVGQRGAPIVCMYPIAMPANWDVTTEKSTHQLYST